MKVRYGAAAGLVLALLWSLGAAPSVWAHRVNVFAWVEGDTVHVEGKFSGGKEVHEGTVTVTDPEGAVLLKGTMEEGKEFVFAAPRKTDLTIVLNAGMGHRGEWTVRADEITLGDGENGSGTLPASPAPADVGFASAETPAPPKTDAPEPASAPPVVSIQEIERVVDQALDRKLNPIMKMLAESRESGPSATEIFGGIGYIFGIMGVAAWFQSRRSREK